MTNIMYGIKFYLFFGEEALQIKMIKLLKTKKKKKTNLRSRCWQNLWQLAGALKEKSPQFANKLNPNVFYSVKMENKYSVVGLVCPRGEDQISGLSTM